MNILMRTLSGSTTRGVGGSGPMRRRRRYRPPRELARVYALTIAIIAGATLVRLALDRTPALQGRATFAFYYLSILFTAWFFGVGPTIVAILGSLVAAWAFVLPPEGGFGLSLVVFLFVSGAMVIMARAARARHDALAFSAAVLECSDDAIATKDLDGVIRSWNPGAQRLFGYSAEEIVGHRATGVIPDELRDEEESILNRLRRGEQISHFETVRIRKDGRRIHVSLSISPVRGPFGEILGASTVARDISDKKREEEQIADEREWLDRTLKSIGDAVIATDADGKVVFLNPVAEQLTGWRSEDARGRESHEVFNIINETTRKPIDSPIAQVRRTGAVVGLTNANVVLISKDGLREVPIDDSGAPILGRDGSLRGVVLVFRDVTERRRAEVERRDVGAEREQLLKRERAARNEAENANRSKDEFVAMVSHELRTPLNAIMGWTQILQNRVGDVDTMRRGLEVIARNTRAQEQLVSDLLDMSRIISGKLRLDVHDVDLITIINAAIETTRAAADAKGITIDTALDPSVASTTGDPTRLQQCVWNLLSNAIKFTPQGGRVTIALSRSDSHVTISVTDTGIGIPANFLPLVFERFRQAETGNTRRTGGLGLGLSIVKQLAELHGGCVAVTSEGEGKGSTFTISLPVKALRVSPSEDGGAQSMSDPSARSLDGLHILVVEDEPDNRDVLRTLLEEHRAIVTVAGSGGEALDKLEDAHPDILVSDIGLPEVDGYELIRRIRQLGSTKGGRVPAIALTAHASSSDRTKALRAGFQAHVTKPVEPRELIANIISLTRLMARPSSVDLSR